MGARPISKRRGKFSNQKGLSLVELMLSFGLFALVAAASVYGLIQAHHMSEDSRYRLLAVNAARSVLEEIKETPLQNVPNFNVSGFIPSDLPSGAITIATNPTSLATAPVATVTVTISWAGAKNAARQLQVTTMRSAF
ncbi:MAG: prepilin-type N-terminal cleavage/methylation domain-containing protein [Candidatus Omnitrophica bacterium]|nr:prepilin-type N-terminal cleavage/methylation domain-containing protein [Candidatus Omnitrophota bacterium]